jgi:4-amino-4-deoxychorismate lyase
MFLYHNHNLLQQSNINITNRGFLFGDGAFETCLIHNKNIINFSQHLHRLALALQYLEISYPLNQLEHQAQNLINVNNLNHGILRIQISRDVGSIGYLPTANCKTTSILNLLPFREIPTKINLMISSRNLFGLFPFKSSNSLPYVLAKIDAHKNNAFDSILLNSQQHICETGSANIFWVKNKQIFSPDSSCGLVLGIIRQLIANHYCVNFIKADLKCLQDADEVFITNSIILVKSVDVIKFDNKISKNYQQKKVANEIASFLQEKLLIL